LPEKSLCCVRKEALAAAGGLIAVPLNVPKKSFRCNFIEGGSSRVVLSAAGD
jgi:hypothetical protein